MTVEESIKFVKNELGLTDKQNMNAMLTLKGNGQ